MGAGLGGLVGLQVAIGQPQGRVRLDLPGGFDQLAGLGGLAVVGQQAGGHDHAGGEVGLQLGRLGREVEGLGAGLGLQRVFQAGGRGGQQGGAAALGLGRGDDLALQPALDQLQRGGPVAGLQPGVQKRAPGPAGGAGQAIGGFGVADGGGLVALGQGGLHQAAQARQAHLGKAQHGVVGGLGGGKVAGRLGGLGGQDANQGGGLLGQLGRLLGQAAGFGAVAGGHGEEAARQGLDRRLALGLGPGAGGAARGLDDPYHRAPDQGEQQGREQGQKRRGRGGHLDAPAHPFQPRAARLPGQGQGPDRDGGDQEEGEGQADHGAAGGAATSGASWGTGAREARDRPARASARTADRWRSMSIRRLAAAAHGASTSCVAWGRPLRA